MRGLSSLSSGLLIGLVVAVTVFGALVLSVRGSQPVLISELPIPTATIQTDAASPTPTHGVTQPPTTAITATAVVAAPSLTPTPTSTSCPTPPDWQRYSVGPFDTLLSIAQQFNLTPDQLVQSNCLTEASVVMGQTIFVPPFRPTPTYVPCYPPFNWLVYIVQPGDTLGSIAYRYGISLYTLMRANCLSTTYIYYGQRLYVPPIYPIVTFTPTPIVPTFTPTPPIGTLTPTIPPSETPTPVPTTSSPTPPVITETPGPTATPGPTDTPAPTNTPEPTTAPTNTPAPTVAPTQPPPTTVAPTAPPPNTPEPPPTVNATP